MKFLSEEWAHKFCEAWNNNEELVNELKSFDAILHYRYSDREQAPIQLTIQKGKCVYSGAVKDEPADFEMWATAENWKKITSGDIGVRSAMLTKRLGFKGSMIKAMKHMKAFEKSINLMGTVKASI